MIKWKDHYKHVRRSQRRIYRASQQGDNQKVGYNNAWESGKIDDTTSSNLEGKKTAGTDGFIPNHLPDETYRIIKQPLPNK